MNQKKKEVAKPSPASKAPSTPVEKSKSLTEEKSSEASETSVHAMSTKARAEIEAAYVMAKQFPRVEEDARVKVVQTCQIPSFAEKAKYAKPIGKIKIIGPSIRLAEEMLRQWGHIDVETSIIFENVEKRIVQVRAIDLQTNAINRAQFIIEKTVERKNATGRVILAERLNSSNEKVHIVAATEDEIFVKQNAIASKFRRNLILQLIPTYILEDALAAVDSTIKTKAKADPNAATKKICDNFAKHKVMPSDLEQYLGHPVQTISVDEVADLKALYNSLSDKQTTWKEIMETKGGESKVETAEMDTGLKSGAELFNEGDAEHQPV